MADNPNRYGFRWVKGVDGGKPMDNIEEHVVATAASFDVTAGAANVQLRKGDVVKLLSTGTITLCEGAETTIGIPYGVVAGIKQYYDGARVRYSPEFLPSDIAWGTNFERRSIVLVTPISAGIWEVDTNAAGGASFDTEAEYQAVVGENIDFINTGLAGELFANPKLSFASHATTDTLGFRIIGISKSVENLDFSGNFVKLHVIPTIANRPWSARLGT